MFPVTTGDFFVINRSGIHSLPELNPNFSKRCLIPNQRHIIMQLENRSRHFRCDRAEESTLYDICLVFSVHYYQDLLCLHDRLDSHRICLFWHIVGRCEESLICLNRALCQIYTMCFLFKCFSRLIETDMSITSQS